MNLSSVPPKSALNTDSVHLRDSGLHKCGIFSHMRIGSSTSGEVKAGKYISFSNLNVRHLNGVLGDLGCKRNNKKRTYETIKLPQGAAAPVFNIKGVFISSTYSVL